MKMKVLDFPCLKDMLEECRIHGIERIAILVQRETRQVGQPLIPFVFYWVVATATKDKADFIIRWKNNVGHRIAYDEAAIKELHKEAHLAFDATRSEIAKMELGVVEAIWGTIGGN